MMSTYALLFPHNRQEDLFRVLKVHAQVSPDEYCQAHAPLAAVLLMQMPAEPAFWCLKAICDKYVPGYYAPGLVSVLEWECVMQGEWE